MVGAVFDASVTCCYVWCCPNGVLFYKEALQELTIFYKQLELGTSPQICLYIQDFQGLKLLNGCLGLVVWPMYPSDFSTFPSDFSIIDILYTISPISKQFLWNL